MSQVTVTKHGGRFRASPAFAPAGSLRLARRQRLAGRLRLAAAVAAVFCAQRNPARAITIRDDTDPSLYVNLGAQSSYAASGYIDIVTGQSGNTTNYNFESAILIAPDWVITAAHGLISSGTNSYAASAVTFGQGATASFPAANSAAQVRIESGFNGDLTQGNDLALIQLNTPVTNVAPAPIYVSTLGTLQGQTATVVGYGDTGTGVTGFVAGSLGTRMAMQNVLDNFGGQTTNGGTDGNTHYNNLGGYSLNIVFSDFDSPNSADWSTTNLMGDPSPLTLEGATAPGDSGGGAFVTVNGQTFLAAVTSFGYNFFTNNPLSQYGEAQGYTSLTATSSINFINANLVVSSNWLGAAGGTWASLSSWDNANIPEFAKASANFGASITSPSSVTLDAAWTVGTVTFNNSNSYTIAPGTNGSLTFDGGKSSATTLLTDSAGSHYITAPITLNSNLHVTVINAGDVLTLSGPIVGHRNVSLSGNGILRFAAGVSTPTLAALSINTGSTLDITTNAVVIAYGAPAFDPISIITGYLASGYHGGSWTGTGINSSTAAAGISPALSVGYADGNTDFGTPAQPNQLLIKYTLAGDANLDGLVNFADLVTVIQNFNKAGTDWSKGNFGYGASTNFGDLVAVIQNFNKVLTPAYTAAEQLGGNQLPLGLSASISATSVQLPEPSFCFAFGVGTAAILKRRRRASSPNIPRRTS